MEKLILKEVSPRDGLQTVKPVSLGVKEEFIRKLVTANIKNIEVGSFVNEQKVPQMSGAKELIKNLDDIIEENNFFALVFTPGQMKEILMTKLKEVSVFVGTTETFNLKNINCTTFKAMDRVAEIGRIAHENNMCVRAYIAMAFGCPYEGKVKIDYVMRLIRYFEDLGVDEIVLADTIGGATPTSIKEVLMEVKKECQISKIGLHLHDTKGIAVANTFKAIEEGVRIFDSSVGGLGGCPFTPDAKGNISTEQMLAIASEVGLATDIDNKKLKLAKEYIFNNISNNF